MNVQLKLYKDSSHIIKNLIDWMNKNYSKNYWLDIVGSEATFEIITIHIEDEDLNALCRIGSNYGRINTINGKVLEPFNFCEKTEYKNMSFRIISEDDKLIISVINYLYQHYNVKFHIKNFIYDEVIFAIIESEYAKLEHIFYLGCAFGIKSQIMRERGEIDW